MGIDEDTLRWTIIQIIFLMILLFIFIYIGVKYIINIFNKYKFI